MIRPPFWTNAKSVSSTFGATSKGFEVEMAVSPGGGINIGFNASYNDSKITKLSPIARLDIDGPGLAEEMFRAYLHQILVVGVFPFWDGLRRKPQVRRVLAGVNAAVVGLLLAALWDPVIVSGIHRPLDAVLALAALAALMLLRMPPWLVVGACAAAGAGVAAL